MNRRWIASLCLVPALLRADAPRTAPELLPPSLAVVAELADPDALVRTLTDHPLRPRLAALPPVREFLDGPKGAVARGVLAMLELQMNRTWRAALSGLAGGGVWVGLDAETRGVVVLLRGRDPAVADQFFASLQAVAALQKNPGAVTTLKEDGFTVHKVGAAYALAQDGWVMATNHEELGKRMLARFQSGKGDSLASQPFYRDADPAGDGDLRVILNLEAFRQAGAAPALFQSKTDNLLAELLFGHLLSALPAAPRAVLDLSLRPDHLGLRARTTAPANGLPPSRAYARAAAAPPLLPEVPNALFNLRLARDWGAFWQASPELYGENTNAKISKADSDLANLFSGRRIGPDLLGEIAPEIAFVAAAQDFNAIQPAPTGARLPGFAVTGRLKNPAKMQPVLKLSFQNLIGFLNIVGSMANRPPFELDLDAADGAKFFFARSRPDAMPDVPGGAKDTLSLNFSPTVAFAGDRFVIASTVELAKQIAAANTPAATPPGLFSLNLSAPALRAVLAENREPLIAKNMLEKGQSRQEAEGEIGFLLLALDWVRDLRLGLDQGARGLEASLRLTFTPAAK